MSETNVKLVGDFAFPTDTRHNHACCAGGSCRDSPRTGTYVLTVLIDRKQAYREHRLVNCIPVYV